MDHFAFYKVIEVYVSFFETKVFPNQEMDHFAFYKVIEVYVSFFGTKVFPNQFLIRGS